MGKTNERNAVVQGLILNYASIGILSVSGFIFNIMIMLFYDASVLGIFNQVYSWYIVFSQITVLGIQASVTKYSAEFQDNEEENGKIIGSALVCTAISALVVSFLIECVLNVISVERTQLIDSIKLAVLALVFFSLNKVILGFFNGMSKMNAYAIFQALRYLLIAAGIVGLALWGCQGTWITLCFLIAESVLFLISMIYLFTCKIVKIRCSGKWMTNHLKFGVKIIPSNFVLELNTKADVICLGVLLKDDYLIGIYSFALLFAEGFYQLFVVLRRSLNPVLTQQYMKDMLGEYWNGLKAKVGKPFYWGVFGGYLALLCGYYVLCNLLGKQEYISGILPLAIVCCSIALNAKYIVMGNLFSQIGMPLEESYVNVVTVVSNVGLNLICIILWGCMGAAGATAVSYFVFSAIIRKKANNKIGFEI